MSEQYVLKKEVANIPTLDTLNDDSKYFTVKIYECLKSADFFVMIEDLEDWIAALKSGKKIVNPMSPREELITLYQIYHSSSLINRENILVAIKRATEIIAKEHPDVKDWLKDINEHD